MFKPMTTYSDIFDGTMELTKDELKWFRSVVRKAKKATGCPVEIISYDHEKYEKQHREALGCCVTTDVKHRLDEEAETFITIDTFFIHEKYEERFMHGFSLEELSLEQVIAHEIAHLKYWRHTKYHAALTDELLEKITA